MACRCSRSRRPSHCCFFACCKIFLVAGKNHQSLPFCFSCCVTWLLRMSTIDPPALQNNLDRQSTGGLPSAADIWSTGAAAEAHPAKTVEKIAPGKVAVANVTTEPIVAEPVTAESVTTERVVDQKVTRDNVVPAEKVPLRRISAMKFDSGLQGIPSISGAREESGSAQGRVWPPRRLSLALQGGGSFGAFTWGVLDRLLEEPSCGLDSISGASAGAVNAVLLASGFVEGGRECARARLRRFWRRITDEASFRSLMVIGGFSPAGSCVAFGQGFSAQFDPLDFDPLRQALATEIDFASLREPTCPKLLIATTRVRNGQLQIFRNKDLTADVVLASTCPPLIHCAVEIEGEAYWDGGFAANPPVVQLVHASEATDVLVVQITPTRDAYVPMTMAAIDRRIDQITANSTLNAEIAALELARDNAVTPKLHALRLFRIAAEDTVDGLAQRSSVDLGQGFITMLHRSGRDAADRWLSRNPDVTVPARRKQQADKEKIGAFEFQPAPMETV
jgi:NTE family protein